MAENKLPVALVTGVGPGLGAGLARRFAKEYAVAINARKPDFLRSLATEIRGAGGQVIEAPGDIGDPAQISAIFKTIHERLGCPEVLLYNAGSGEFGSIVDISVGQYEKDWRVNALGAFACA